MPFLMLIIFGLYGWVEFETFIVIANAVGGLLTFVGIFVTALIGVTLMKRQGQSIMRQWQTSLSNGEVKTSTLTSGVSLMLGAVLMLLPGYLTDLIGLLCFAPYFRALIGRAILSRLGASVFSSNFASGFSTRFDAAGGFSPHNQTGADHHEASSYARKQTLENDVIEGQFETKDTPQK